jgi:hypothetical protein
MWSSWLWLLITASTRTGTPPRATTVTDGSISTASPAPRTRRVLPDGYAPLASPTSTLTDGVSRRSSSPHSTDFLTTCSTIAR